MPAATFISWPTIGVDYLTIAASKNISYETSGLHEAKEIILMWLIKYFTYETSNAGWFTYQCAESENITLCAKVS